MKQWTAPEMVEVNISETAHNIFGFYQDGGYVGDGIISGHLSFDKPETPEKPEKPELPEEPTGSLS